MAAYLGETDEEKILDMSIPFFDNVIIELGYKLNYEAIVNYAGNSFFEKSWEVITDNNPFNVGEDMAKKRNLQQMGGLFSGMSIETVERSSPELSEDNAKELAALQLYEATVEGKS